MPISTVATFWLVALLLIATPGADWAFTLAAALRGDAVLAAVAGLVTGYLAMTLVVAAGIGTLLAGSPGAMTVIDLAGGAYLIRLGLAAWHRPDPAAGPGARSGRGPGRGAGAGPGRAGYLGGVAVSGLNPKGLLIFVALLPQFADRRAGWPVAVQLAVLGLTFTATCAGFYLVLGAVAQAVLRARPGVARAMTRISGAGMTLIGTVLVLQRLVGRSG